MHVGAVYLFTVIRDILRATCKAVHRRRKITANSTSSVHLASSNRGHSWMVTIVDIKGTGTSSVICLSPVSDVNDEENTARLCVLLMERWPGCVQQSVIKDAKRLLPALQRSLLATNNYTILVETAALVFIHDDLDKDSIDYVSRSLRNCQLLTEASTEGALDTVDSGMRRNKSVYESFTAASENGSVSAFTGVIDQFSSCVMSWTCEVKTDITKPEIQTYTDLSSGDMHSLRVMGNDGHIWVQYKRDRKRRQGILLDR